MSAPAGHLRAAWHRRWITFSVAFLSSGFIATWYSAQAAEKPTTKPSQNQAATARSFPGLADPGKALALEIELGGPVNRSTTKPVTLRGPDARMQLVVAARYDSGQLRDQSRKVTWAAAPAGIVQVDPTGLVTPLADGKATLTATGAAGLKAAVAITVEKFAEPDPINFANAVVPVFTKSGCNSGGCHGKSGGQNGFRLSLLGFEPQKDYQYLVKEARGRRLFPAAPDQSLLLLKSSNAVAHGGGERIKADTLEYRILRRWIAQGMPYGSPEDPTLTGVRVYPQARIMPADGTQQLRVIADYSDGSTQDVTRGALYEANDKEMAEIDNAGSVKLMGRPGDVAVMVRYQGRVSVFSATAPVGAPIKPTDFPKPRNFIDELAFNKLVELGLPPSALCDDATFLRRVTVDITGQLPAADVARAFLADKDIAKRDRLVDRLLASDGYADLFANKWAGILRNKREKETYQRGNYLFYDWLRASLSENKRYDQIVRELLTASGDVAQAPAVSWYRQVDKTNEQVEDAAQLFLGLRIQCARCHHHPYEKWSQDDYYGMVAFFSRVNQKEGSSADETRVYHKRGEAAAANPNTGKSIKPTPLGGTAMLALSPDDDPRPLLVDWMTAKENPFFARALVNRYWKHFFGRGIVDAEDDMRETNPPSNPKLLDALATSFAASGYDLKALIRGICQSNLYQLSATPNAYNAEDRQSYSRYYPRRLGAEVLLDAIDSVAGTSTNFSGVGIGARSMQIPDHGGVQSYFLQVFGRPAGASACECERAGDTSLAQTLQLLNSGEMYDKLSSGRTKSLASAEDTRADADKITDLYYVAMSRPPRADELEQSLAYLGKFQAKDRQAAFEDLLWAMLNTKEFLFNH